MDPYVAFPFVTFYWPALKERVLYYRKTRPDGYLLLFLFLLCMSSNRMILNPHTVHREYRLSPEALISKGKVYFRANTPRATLIRLMQQQEDDAIGLILSGDSGHLLVSQPGGLSLHLYYIGIIR